MKQLFPSVGDSTKTCSSIELLEKSVWDGISASSGIGLAFLGLALSTEV
jgi:hypothetical protein